MTLHHCFLLVELASHGTAKPSAAVVVEAAALIAGEADATSVATSSITGAFGTGVSVILYESFALMKSI